MQRYLEQLTPIRRPSTVRQCEGTIREFALFLTRTAPDVTSVSAVRRVHVEAYRAWLANRPAKRQDRSVTKKTLAKRLAILGQMFERLVEWGWEDAPTGRLVHRGDFPILDRPLPRFIDDGAAARLLVAARAEEDLFSRVAVEFLARTGLRCGEFLDLTVDAVVQIGSAFWLRVPIGKLHNDRYIPLHPHLKDLLDLWLTARPAEVRSPFLWVERGQRIRRGRVVGALDRAAAAAGIGHVSPHQLRHTFATQAINRGMSLEALAALLGHKSLSMTLVYARIADRTVADEYFAVTEKVEALYEAAKTLPAEDEGSEMAKLRREMDRRMLGNGYCARPVELDCHFESICESCTFFVTTIEFKPTLERQKEDAAAKGQLGRQRIFEGLLTRLNQEAG
jgi:site-specific recombinase XerD